MGWRGWHGPWPKASSCPAAAFSCHRPQRFGHSSWSWRTTRDMKESRRSCIAYVPPTTRTPPSSSATTSRAAPCASITRWSTCIHLVFFNPSTSRHRCGVIAMDFVEGFSKVGGKSASSWSLIGSRVCTFHPPRTSVHGALHQTSVLQHNRQAPRVAMLNRERPRPSRSY
jgi:hypothetical protein